MGEYCDPEPEPEPIYEIRDEDLAPCLKDVSNDLMRMPDGENGSINAIFHVLQNKPNYNWNLIDGRLPAGTSGSTRAYNRDNHSVNTIFDSRQFSNYTDLSVARTIIHESIHAYLIAYFANDPLAANRDFAQLLIDYNKAISTS